MKLYCPISGVSYKATIGYGSGQAPHPIFYLTTEHLLEQSLTAYIEGKLSPTESHLLGCALLHKLPVRWETAVSENENTERAWCRNLEKLAAVAASLPADISKLPTYHIERGNNTLHNLGHYLTSLSDVISELAYLDEGGDPDMLEVSHAMRTEAELRIISIIRQTLNQSEKVKTLPTLIADWAASVGRFPKDIVPLPNGGHTTLREHWKDIIIQCFRTDNYVSIVSGDVTCGDVDELIEHCEAEIEVGTVHHTVLLKRLREAKEVLQEFRSPARVREIQIIEHHNSLERDLLGIDEHGNKLEPAHSVSYPSTEVEDLETVADTSETTSDSGSKSEPLRKNYPNLAAYVRAKMRWQSYMRQMGDNK